MDRRAEEVRDALRALDPSIAQRVYYQPPTGFTLTYPCIIFELSNKPTKYANDLPYGWDHQYSVTYISNEADEVILNGIGRLPCCRFDRMFVNDNLYHYVYQIQH